MLYFTSIQNNSGGYFIQNDKVGTIVIVQAENAQQAIKKFDKITFDYSEYCDCCGSRWDYNFLRDQNGTENPTVYGEGVYEYAKKKNSRSSHIIIYHQGDKIERLIK